MRFERLVIESGTTNFTFELHPRLTVIAGLGRIERDALAAELLGAVVGSRSGVHVEAVDDLGRRLAVFRPTGARARVVDVDRVQDVTHEFVDPSGRISLMASAGIDAGTLRRKLRFGGADLEAASHGAALIRQLAEADQPRLWAAADALLTAEENLQAEADELGSAPEDAEVIERVEQRHQRFEAAQARHERLRKFTLATAALAGAGAVAAHLFVSNQAGIGLILAACIAMLVSVYTRGKAERARKAEGAALAEAGAQSYLGFHLQRVNGMLSSEQARKRLLTASQAHRDASAAWIALAGEIPPAWAIEHHEEIAAAARVHVDITAHATMAAEPTDIDDGTTELARVLVGRLAELRRLGNSTESCPLVLDDPFADLDRSAKPALLELVSHASGAPQLIYLTDDEDVATWARLEALAGGLSLIEPAAPPAHPERTRRTIHL